MTGQIVDTGIKGETVKDEDEKLQPTVFCDLPASKYEQHNSAYIRSVEHEKSEKIQTLKEDLVLNSSRLSDQYSSLLIDTLRTSGKSSFNARAAEKKKEIQCIDRIKPELKSIDQQKMESADMRKRQRSNVLTTPPVKRKKKKRKLSGDDNKSIEFGSFLDNNNSSNRLLVMARSILGNFVGLSIPDEHEETDDAKSVRYGIQKCRELFRIVQQDSETSKRLKDDFELICCVMFFKGLARDGLSNVPGLFEYTKQSWFIRHLPNVNEFGKFERVNSLNNRTRRHTFSSSDLTTATTQICDILRRRRGGGGNVVRPTVPSPVVVTPTPVTTTTSVILPPPAPPRQVFPITTPRSRFEFKPPPSFVRSELTRDRRSS
jgi:hypothetical protein